jgi:hypothetical protein
MREYDAHYQSCHRHQCATCDLVLPVAKYLELHVQERHDDFFAELARRQKMVC